MDYETLSFLTFLINLNVIWEDRDSKSWGKILQANSNKYVFYQCQLADNAICANPQSSSRECLKLSFSLIYQSANSGLTLSAQFRGALKKTGLWSDNWLVERKFNWGRISRKTDKAFLSPAYSFRCADRNSKVHKRKREGNE